MKKLVTLTITLLVFATGFSQTDAYNLKSQNLHKKVAKTIEHHYLYHKRSGGFIKSSVTIKNYNEDGLLIDKYYQYNSTYSGSTSTTETLYHYNAKNQLTNTEDISAKRGAYSSNYVFHYDKKGNVIKKESVFKNGNKYAYNYYYDTKNRLTRAEEFDSKGKLTTRQTYSYNGNKKTSVRKSYSTKTGNVVGTYTTYFKNDQKVRYTSQSKYSNNDVSYHYDKKDNLISAIYKDKPNSSSHYVYEYDKKGNWIKKHYKYGKKSGNNYYFREIIFRNGSTSGSTDFDKNFINRNGNYGNVAIVPIVKYTPKNNKKTTTSINPKIPVFETKNYIFNYVNLDKKVSSVNGEVVVNVLDNDRMSKGTKVKITYSFAGKNYADTYTVSSYLNTKDYHFWSLKSTTKSTKVSFSINHKKKFIASRDMYLSGMLNISLNNKNTGFYLED